MVNFRVWPSDVPKIRVAHYRIAGAAGLGSQPERRTAPVPDYAKELSLDETIGHAVSGTDAVFLSPLANYCTGGNCLLMVPGTDKSVAWDYAHLTVASSEFFIDANAAKILGR